MTPTEAVKAYDYGADIVKLFPAASMGIDYLKAVYAPLKHIPFAAVGGINHENACQILQTGVKVLGVGGKLVSQNAIKKEAYDLLTDEAKKLVEAVNNYRASIEK